VAAVAGLCLVGLVVAAVVLQTAISGLPKRTGVPNIAPPLADTGIVETLRLPRIPTGAPSVAVTNGDLPDINQPLQVVQLFADGRLVVHTMSFDSIPLQHPANGGNAVLPDVTVQGRPFLGPPGKTWFAVTGFGSGDALVAARQLRNGHLRVTELALRQGLPRLRAAVVPAPRPMGLRTVTVATWKPPAPDLFVIDRGAGKRTPVAVRIYSGESGFHKLILKQSLPVAEPRPDWIWQVAGIQGRPADIILAERRGDSGRPEVHVLAASAFYAVFAQHLAIPARPISPKDQIVIGTRLGQAAEYIVRLTGPNPSVSLMALPYRTSVPR
jgi:hypothetical protein